MRATAWLHRFALTQARIKVETLTLRSIHASSVVTARRKHRTLPNRAISKPSAVIEGNEVLFKQHRTRSDESEEFLQWFEQIQQQYPTKKWTQDDDDDISSAMELVEDDEDKCIISKDDKEEAEAFVDEAEDLFRLNRGEFQKRMETFDKRHVHEIDDDENEDPDEIDRVTERIPNKKLLKFLEEFNSKNARTGKSAERMMTTNLKNKNSAPLEKQSKLPKAERVTYRQESVGISVLEYLQNLLVEDADLCGFEIVPALVEANVSPDLRKVMLFWEPARLHSENQNVSKKKIEAVKNRLQRKERWVRRNITQYLNLKYSPVIQFKLQEETKAEKARTLFEDEMEWLSKA
ncbi:hypothetical protein PsorP6_002070 [Peronosclerospora sorghi]|uniref:Uncharacterized protein n=1 Tax=Peronosclerospora sorghi TaxID=230839 RepID=A0ACC0WYS8_9STRA|nr:hypothetical protein PsorP6_002070 [Peronosclerospora sorghi]